MARQQARAGMDHGQAGRVDELGSQVGPFHGRVEGVNPFADRGGFERTVGRAGQSVRGAVGGEQRGAALGLGGATGPQDGLGQAAGLGDDLQFARGQDVGVDAGVDFEGAGLGVFEQREQVGERRFKVLGLAGALVAGAPGGVDVQTGVGGVEGCFSDVRGMPGAFGVHAGHPGAAFVGIDGGHGQAGLGERHGVAADAAAGVGDFDARTEHAEEAGGLVRRRAGGRGHLHAGAIGGELVRNARELNAGLVARGDEFGDNRDLLGGPSRAEFGQRAGAHARGHDGAQRGRLVRDRPGPDVRVAHHERRGASSDTPRPKIGPACGRLERINTGNGRTCRGLPRARQGRRPGPWSAW